MTAQILIADCEKSGVAIHMDGGALILRGKPESVKIAADRLQPHKAEILAHLVAANREAEKQAINLLVNFRLDLCLNDPEPELVTRINAIAWYLITQRAWGFDAAFEAAANWADNNRPHADEAGFIDVMELFEKMRQ